MESDPSGAAHIGYLFGKEPTAHALDSALKFIFEHGAQTMPVAAFMPREEKSGDQVAATIEHTQVATTAATTPAKQMAIEQMRQVAKAIKQCPPVVDRMSSPNSQCFSTEAKAGPPLNVTWDVVEKRTARAPYLGYVDFELPGTWLIDQLQPTDRKVAKACDRNYRIEAQGATFLAQAGLAAELGLPDDVEPPRSKVWHFRFEFDVGSDDPELVKMLWTDETGKAQAATAGHSCWGKAAQAVGTSSAH